MLEQNPENQFPVHSRESVLESTKNRYCLTLTGLYLDRTYNHRETEDGKMIADIVVDELRQTFDQNPEYLFKYNKLVIRGRLPAVAEFMYMAKADYGMGVAESIDHMVSCPLMQKMMDNYLVNTTPMNTKYQQ